jgi:outer membrane autotransporter protein
VRLAAENAEAERVRLAAEVEAERVRLAAENAEAERVRLAAENAEAERVRLAAENAEAERVRLAAEVEAERVPIVQIAEREEEEQEGQEGWVDLGQHQGLRGAEEIIARNVAPVKLAQNEEEEGIPAAAPPAPPAPPGAVAAAPAIIPAAAPPMPAAAAPAIIPAVAPPAPPAPPVAVAAAPVIIPAMAPLAPPAPPVAVAAAPVIIPFAVLLPPAVAAAPQYPNLRASSFSEGHSSVVSHLLAAAPGTDLALVRKTVNELPSLQREDAFERILSTQVTVLPEIVESTGSMVNNLTGVRLSNLRSNTGSSGGQQAANFAAGKGQRSLSILNRLQKQNIDRPQETHHNTRAGLAADFDHQMQQSIALSRGKGGVWAHGFGNIGNQKNQKNQRGFKAETGGFMAGMDYRVSSNVFLGGGLGFSSSDVNWKNSGGKGRIRGYFATFYSTWYQGGFYVNGSLVAGVNRYKVGRHLLLGSVIDRTASNHHEGYEFTPHIGMGYEIPFKSLTLEPFVGLDYSHIHQDGYNETGAKDLNLKVKSQSAEMLRGEAGFNIFKTLPFEGGNWTPKLKLSYILKEPTKKGNMQAALQGQPTFFAVKSFTRTRNQFSPGVGMTFRFNSGAFVDVRYDAELDSSYKAHEVGLKIGYAF